MAKTKPAEIPLEQSSDPAPIKESGLSKAQQEKIDNEVRQLIYRERAERRFRDESQGLLSWGPFPVSLPLAGWSHRLSKSPVLTQFWTWLLTTALGAVFLFCYTNWFVPRRERLQNIEHLRIELDFRIRRAEEQLKGFDAATATSQQDRKQKIDQILDGESNTFLFDEFYHRPLLSIIWELQHLDDSSDLDCTIDQELRGRQFSKSEMSAECIQEYLTRLTHGLKRKRSPDRK